MFWIRLFLRISTVAITLIREARRLLAGLSRSQRIPHMKRAAMINITPPSEMIDYDAIQRAMEKLFHKNQLIPRIRRDFEEMDIPWAEAANEAKVSYNFAIELLVQMHLHKRTTIAVLAGIMRKHYTDSINPSQEAADAILRCIEADFADYEPTYGVIVTRWEISAETEKELEAFQFPLPMIVPPRQLTDNENCAYLTVTESAILKKNHHEDYIRHPHLNKMNAIPLMINGETSLMIKNKWRHLDKKKPEETLKDFKDRLKQFEKYDRTVHDVHAHLSINGNRFYLVHSYDKRGRVYPKGYHVNYQGNSWNKAVIEFADGEICE